MANAKERARTGGSTRRRQVKLERREQPGSTTCTRSRTLIAISGGETAFFPAASAGSGSDSTDPPPCSSTTGSEVWSTSL
eukprot:3384018-Rhodomonas_salina.1